MDALIRIRWLILWLLLLPCAVGAQQMDGLRLMEDTVYYAREYFPERIRLTHPGPVQLWDFRALRAPYAIPRRIVIINDKDGVATAQYMNGKRTTAMLQLQGESITMTQRAEANPVCLDFPLNFIYTPAYKPFFDGVLGESTSYKGRMTATFAWPKHVSCGWTPPQLPDSCRITYTVNEDIVVDGEGTLYLPTEVNKAYRQHISRRRGVKVEILVSRNWQDVTQQVPGLRLQIQQDIIRFCAADDGLMLAELEMRDETIFRAEFKTHPIATRIVQDEPDHPDVFAFPNPSYDIVRFQMTDLPMGKYTLKLFNILGSPIRQTEVNIDDARKTISLDLGDLQRGTYLYRLQDSQGRVIKTKRVVLIQA